MILYVKQKSRGRIDKIDSTPGIFEKYKVNKFI